LLKCKPSIRENPAPMNKETCVWSIFEPCQAEASAALCSDIEVVPVAIFTIEEQNQALGNL